MFIGASILPIITTTQTVAGGFSVDATLNMGGANYLGPVSDINRGMLQTNIGQGDVTYTGGFGISALAKLGATGGYTSTPTGSGIVSFSINAGLGLPAGDAPVNASLGVSNTFILKDFRK
ncbi:hypothetical protein DVR12_10785 [Chitinophaga silvatica]|uniref:Uncharacterized protein n=1 Tax=Chitinophaga silvatica TaxID=2282649 RepID=A0A3E1YBW3_9BACT|nr:hypothetical protein [Chitinophaga silvatica]RFS23490.1 hypothetical protein DVR12_10785 [Chitinophaga silvatica]